MFFVLLNKADVVYNIFVNSRYYSRDILFFIFFIYV